MNKVEQTISYLRAKGQKITLVRHQILQLLYEAKTPVVVTEIIQQLAEIDLKPNKTTIYRELAFLLEQGIIKEIDFGESKKRYEFRTEQHHHHIICIKCKKVENVELDQDLTTQEARIAVEKNYQIINHSLEFFGVCAKCQQN